MKTRMELWKTYRKEIENNIFLYESVIESNTKLKILFNRLKKAFPEYTDKYKLSNITNENLKILKENIKPDLLSLAKEEETIKIIDDILNPHEFQKKDVNFSSHKYESIIMKIQEWHNPYITTDEVIEIEKENKEIVLKPDMQKINIAIDGPSGSGKSSVAKDVAKRLNYKYINTGLVYRAIALYCINNKIKEKDTKKMISALKKIKLELLTNEVVILNDQDVSKEVRSDRVSIFASVVAAIPEVREWAVKLQQSFAQDKGVIMDGRDTTFVVMPNAELKIFLDTSAEVRAKRRVEQNKKLGYETNFKKILKDIKLRDNRDRTREKDPLHKTKDAILIDASKMTLQAVISKVLKLALEKIVGK